MAKGKGKNKGKNKGKTNNPYGGKKGSKKNNPYGGKKGSLKINPANYESKPQKQAYMSQIFSDGKITPQEAKNATSIGLTPERIIRNYDKSFVPGNVFSRAPKGGRGPSQIGGTRPAYTPLIIGGKASRVLEAGRTPSPLMIHKDGAIAPDGQSRLPLDDDTVEVNPLQGALDEALGTISDLQGQLAEKPDFAALFQGLAESTAAQRQADLEAARQQQALFMEEMAARQAEQERMRFLTSQTQQQNAARSGLGVDFRLGSRRDNLRMGTGGFKRRRRFRPETIAQGIAPMTPTAGATNGNLLNV